jgi:hypothetical protein
MTVPQTTAADTPATNGANGAFPADVMAFATANQVEHCLQPLLEATHRIFPTARSVKVSVEEDPELHDNTQIVFRVQMAGLGLTETRAADKQGNQELLRICPPIRSFPFCLLLDLKH